MITVANDSLARARELFIRINSLGMALSAADRTFARATRFDLRHLAEKFRLELPDAFRALGYERILHARAILDGINDVARIQPRSAGMFRRASHW